MPLVGCVTVPCGLKGAQDPRRSGNNNLTEKRFAFSGLSRKRLPYFN